MPIESSGSSAGNPRLYELIADRPKEGDSPTVWAWPQLIDHLKAQGLYDDALVVLISSHGIELGEQSDRWLGYTKTLSEEAIRLTRAIDELHGKIRTPSVIVRGINAAAEDTGDI